MPDQITQLLEKIERLELEIYPGPWVVCDRGIGYEITTQHQVEEAEQVNGYPIPINSGLRETFERSDADWIALSSTAMPAMAKALRAALKECQAAKDLARKDAYVTSYGHGMIAKSKAIEKAITAALEGS